MSAATVSSVSKEEIRVLPPSEPLNEAAWQAWLSKGRAREERAYWKRVNAAKLLSMAGVAGAVGAGIFAGLALYDTPIRFVVATGSVALMCHELRMRRYAHAIAFAALAVIYNPLAPLLNFADDWGRGLAALSGVPFLTMSSRSPKEASHA
jgi:hypothetical protein